MCKIKNLLNKIYSEYELIIKRKYGDSYYNKQNNIICILEEISKTIKEFYDPVNLEIFLSLEMWEHNITMITEEGKNIEYNIIFDKDLFMDILESIYMYYYILSSNEKEVSIAEKSKIIKTLKKEGIPLYKNLLKYVKCINSYIEKYIGRKDGSMNFKKEIENFKEEIILCKKCFKKDIQNFEKEIKEEETQQLFRESKPKEEEIKKEEYFKKDIQDSKEEIRFLKIAETETERKDFKEVINKEDEKDFEEKIETQEKRKNKELFRII